MKFRRYDDCPGLLHPARTSVVSAVGNRTGVLFSILSLSFWAIAADAHPQYITLPVETVTDKLEASESVVLARPTSTTSLQFQSKIWLKGDRSVDAPPIPHLIDSVTRRRFDRYPENAMVFAYRPDGPGWDRIAYADAQVIETVQNILDELPNWAEGREDPDRFAFFAARHAHPNLTIRNLALVELAQARYSQIRNVNPQFSRSEILAVMRDPYKAPFVPLFTVMLGLVEDDEAATLVRNSVARAEQLDLNTDLTAWGTALIEIDKEEAVEKLGQIVLRMGQQSRTRKTAETAMTALALHGTEGHVMLRDRIAEILSEAAGIDAGFAASAVSTLVEWQDWRAATIVEQHLADSAPLGLQERMALTAYFALAQQAEAVGTDEK